MKHLSRDTFALTLGLFLLGSLNNVDDGVGGSSSVACTEYISHEVIEHLGDQEAQRPEPQP